MTTAVHRGLRVEIDGGQGARRPCAVMVHGLGGTSNTFTPILSAFADCRTIRPDLPGSGRSPLAAGDTERLTIDRFVADILGVMDDLGVERADLVGHSLGTIVCQHLTVRAPERVRSMVLLGALTEPPDAARTALRQRARDAREAGMAEIADAVSAAATARSTRSDLAVAVAAIRESLMRQPPAGYAATCEALSEAAAAPAREIGCPVLLITGEEDAVAPPAMARTLADQMPNARLSLLPRCGHWPSFERAADVTRDARYFYLGLRH